MSVFKGPLRTGGILNKIAHNHHVHGAIQTINSVHVCRTHGVKTEPEMAEQLRVHAENVCEQCGEFAVGGGYFSWINNLWFAVKEERAKALPNSRICLIDYEDCVNFMYDLFVRSPIRGVYMEDRAFADLTKDTRHVGEGRHATPFEDTKYAVDLVFPGVGVQVKPISFKIQAERYPKHMESCLRRNKKWGQPVHYLYYDVRLEWVNYSEVSDAVLGVMEELAAAMDDEP